MSELDKRIEEALSEEDCELMQHFDEQGIYAQWFSIYKGRQAWTAIIATIAMLMVFALAAYCAWKFFGAENNIQEIKWGAATWFLMTMIAFMKVWFWMRTESNRVIREVKRLELQIARLSR